MSENFTISTALHEPTKQAEEFLWPEIEPFDEGYLPVSRLHSLWFAQYGNPHGLPVVVLHGGPGGGCGPRDMRYFDPTFYRIILFDQRGAGRSRPIAETRENETAELVADVDTFRRKFGIAKWLVFGGSWGSALALAYGETHAENCLGFILRGVFLGTKEEYLKLWHGMGDIYPEEFAAYVEFLPEAERSHLLESYYRRLMDSDPSIHLPAARAFYQYDQICATLVDKSRVALNLKNDDAVLALSRLFAHYSKHEFFFAHEQLMNNLASIRHLPAALVHGRYDVICRVASAYRLHKAWPGSSLTIVQDAGHAGMEPGITRGLVEAAEQFKRRLS